MGRRWFGLVAAGAGLALAAAACTGTAASGGSGGDGGEELSGDLFISGSSTVEPITALVAEKFVAENPGVNVSVEGPGTGDGFELFCNGETAMSDASRRIDPDEAAICEQNGIRYVELEVGIDGISVLTSPQNDAITCLDFKDIYALVGPESEGFETWADARPLAEEIGAAHADQFPDAPLTITAPGEESGTYDSFIELVLEGIAEERGQEATTRPDYQSSPNDNVIIEGIAGTPTSFGWVGFSFYENNKDVVKAFEIDGGSGCVAPTEDTIADGSYPITRSLYIYPNLDRVAEDPALRAFVDFYLTDEGIVNSVAEVGYVTLPPDRIEATRAAWAAAAGS
jgi:phosphate transport system substrate-binding protein